MSRVAIERQVITTWTEPPKMPPEYLIVVVTVSLKAEHTRYEHTLSVADWADDGWFFHDPFLQAHRSLVTVHAWADLEPYAGGIDGGEVHYEHG